MKDIELIFEKFKRATEKMAEDEHDEYFIMIQIKEDYEHILCDAVKNGSKKEYIIAEANYKIAELMLEAVGVVINKNGFCNDIGDD